MRLNWIQLFKKVDSKTMKGISFEPKSNLVFSDDIIIKYCPICECWVSLRDYETYCNMGNHKLSKEIKPMMIEDYENKLSSGHQSKELRVGSKALGN